MLRLQFALWRRDVALRKAQPIDKISPLQRSRRQERRLLVFTQRANRWERIARMIEGAPA